MAKTQKTVYLLRRKALPDRTLGWLFVFDDLTLQARFATLELPWRDNQRNISCIPPGNYNIMPRTSPKYGNHLIIKDVPDREYILCHAGNFPKDTGGCILVGMAHADIDGDKAADVTSSRAAMELLTQFIREPARLIIVGA